MGDKARANTFGEIRGLLAEGRNLRLRIAVHGHVDVKGLTGVVRVKTGEDFVVATFVLDGNVAGHLGLLAVPPAGAGPDKVKKVSVTFVWTDGAAGGLASAFPVINEVLHFREKILARHVNVVGSVDQIRVINKGEA
jgi:hypothetical protein